jgi:hypothetical protein
MKLNYRKKSRIILRLFHKGLVGGRNIEVSLCQKVHHPWVDVKRQHTSDVEDVAGMLTISKRVYVHLVDTALQQR